MWQTNLLVVATSAFICAFTVVAPGVRFNAFAIFSAPAFALLETLVDRYPVAVQGGNFVFRWPTQRRRAHLSRPAGSFVRSSHRHPDYLEAEITLGQLSRAVSLGRDAATNRARHESLPIHRLMERRFGRWPELGLILRAPCSQVAEPQHVQRCPRTAIAPVESVQPQHAVRGAFSTMPTSSPTRTVP